METKQLEIEEEREGEYFATNRFMFKSFGAALPVLTPPQPLFDINDLPSRPLAISDRFQLAFVGNAAGFFVVTIRDIIEFARGLNHPGITSIQEFPNLWLNVCIGKPFIVVLSNAEDMIAVSVKDVVHFFKLQSLLNMETEPFFSSSLPSVVKSISWRKGSDDCLHVLLMDGNLFRATTTEPPMLLMDCVDAVDWCSGGNSYVVSTDGNLSIWLTCKRILNIGLTYDSWIDGNENTSIKVDSIIWVRDDCIVLGCIKFCDMEESDYRILVIKTRTGSIIDASSGLILLSFSNAFTQMVDHDVVASGKGPDLIFSSLEDYGIDIVAHRRAKDFHIELLYLPEASDPKLVDILDEQGWPRILLQAGLEYNTIMGFGVINCTDIGFGVFNCNDMDSVLEEPLPVLFCLTLDGKITMFKLHINKN